MRNSLNIILTLVLMLALIRESDAQTNLKDKIDSLISESDNPDLDNNNRKIKLAEEAYYLSVKENYTSGIANAGTVLAYSYFAGREYDSAFTYFRIALEYFTKLNDTNKIGRQLAGIANTFSRTGNLDSSIIYHKRAYKFFIESNDVKRASTQVTSIGLRKMWKGLYPEAESSFNEALQLRRNIGDSAAVAANYNNLGVLYWRWGKLKSSLNMYEKAIDLRDSLNNYRGMVYPKLNVGLILIDLMDYKYAEVYLLEGLRLAEETGYPNGVAVAYLYLTELYLKMGDFAQTEKYAYKTINKCNEVNARLAKVKVSNLLAKSLIEQGRYTEARKILTESLEIIQIYESSQIRTDLYYSLAYLEFRQNNFNRAASYLDDALNGPEPTLNTKRDIDLLAAKTYLILGKYKLSAEYFADYSKLADSMYNKQVVEVVSNWRNKYETTQQENEILKLKEVSLIQDAEIAEQKNIRNIFIISFISVIVIVILLWRLYRQKQKLIVEIEEQKEELAQANEAKLKLFSVIAHDLRNPFMTLLGLTGELKKHREEMDEEDIKSSIEIIDKSAQKLSTLAQNLLAWARLNTDKIKVQPDKYDVGTIVNEVVKELGELARKKEILIHENIDAGLTGYCDKNMISTIIRNLVNNAIKFSHNGGKVDIDAYKTNGNVEVKITDSGIGISDKVKKDLFSSSKFYSTAGTGSEKGSGLGLKISREFARLNHGSISLIDKPGEGSVFVLSFPATKN